MASAVLFTPHQFPKVKKERTSDKGKEDLCDKTALKLMFSYGLWDTLGARGFSCAVSGFGHVLQNDPREKLRRSCLRPLADETKLPVAREKKPLVPRVPTGGSGGYLIAE